MADIPRFRGQTSTINVPSVRNYRQEQNKEIYDAFARNSERIEQALETMYAYGQQHKAEIQGAEDVKEKGESFDLSKLPTAYTPAQKAYNESAMNAYAAQYTVDTSLKLTNLESENRNDPYGFLAKAQAYIDGTSETIPEYMKASIVKPLEMNARSIYASLLKQKVTTDKKAAQDSLMLNVDELIRDAINTEDIEAQDEKIANISVIIDNAVSTGDMTYEYGSKKTLELRSGVADEWILKQLLLATHNPKDQLSIIKMAYEGKTNNQWFDSLSPAERMDSTNKALDRIAHGQNYPGVIAEYKKKYFEAQSLGSISSMILTGAVSDKDLKKFSWNPSIESAFNEWKKSQQKESSSVLMNAIDNAIENGLLDTEEVTQAYDEGIINANDTIAVIAAMNSPEKINKSKPAYTDFKTNLDIELQDKYNVFGGIEEKNNKKEYIEKNMDNFLTSKERTEDEIAQKASEIIEKADKRFKSDNEYSKVHTPAWFKEKTGYDISVVDNIVIRATVNGKLDKKRLADGLLALAGTKQMANKVYSYYVAVRKKKE